MWIWTHQCIKCIFSLFPKLCSPPDVIYVDIWTMLWTNGFKIIPFVVSLRWPLHVEETKVMRKRITAQPPTIGFTFTFSFALLAPTHHWLHFHFFIISADPPLAPISLSLLHYSMALDFHKSPLFNSG